VLHIISGLRQGGAETMLYRLLASLDRPGEHAVVCLAEPGPVAERIEALGVRVSSLAMRGPFSAGGGLLRLRQEAQAHRPAVLQTWLYHADLAGLLLRRWACAPPPSLIWNIRCSDPGLGGRTAHRAMLRLLGRAASRPAAVIVNSEAGRFAHERMGYRGAKWVLIPNGIDTEEFVPDAQAGPRLRRELGVQPGTPLVGLVARHDPLKDHVGFLEAAARVRAARPDVRFVLAGDAVVPSNEELAGALQRLQLGDAVFLLGRHPHVQRLQAGLTLAALSSIAEGFPNVVAEAMACGVPVVTTAAGDAAAIVADTGRVVPIGNPAALAAGLLELLALDEAARARLGAAARRRIEEHYSIGVATGRYTRLYGEVAAAAANAGE
jgi:glycosyltransferase involved in cell wall biosynthesis